MTRSMERMKTADLADEMTRVAGLMESYEAFGARPPAEVQARADALMIEYRRRRRAI